MTDLPPLPVTNVVIDGLWEEVEGPYTADQMRAYALVAVAAEREACAKLIESYPEWISTKALTGAIRAR